MLGRGSCGVASPNACRNAINDNMYEDIVETFETSTDRGQLRKLAAADDHRDGKIHSRS
jgi:hypothetical protein